MFMQMARIVKLRSTCRRAQVGVIITDHDGTTILSMGYNGNARGLKNDCDSEVPGSCGCLHAELNALLKSPYQSVYDLVMYTTTSPCVACAKAIINSQVKTVVFDTMYRAPDGIVLLQQAGIRVYQELDGELVLPVSKLPKEASS
jgi:dCMP deaminase